MKNDITFYILAVLILATITAHRVRRKAHGGYTLDLSDRIKRIAYINEQISACDDLLLEIRLTDHNEIKNIPISWKTVAGIDHKADIFIDGEGGEVTRRMKELVKARRSELVTSLLQEISHLPIRRAGNGNDNSPENGNLSRGEGND